MKIIKQMKNNLKIEIEDIEDIFYLTQLIRKSDIIKTTIERKIKIGNEDEKNKIARKKFNVEILVESVLIEEEVLNIKGKILSEIENLKKMSFENVRFKINDIVEVCKEKFFEFEKKILKKLSTKNFEKILIVLIDKDKIICFEVFGEKHKFLFEKKNLGSKKRYKNEIDEESEKYEILKPFLQNYKKIILCGPFNYKNKLQKFLLDKRISNVLTLDYVDVEKNVIDKVILKSIKKNLINSKNLEEEKILVEKFLENLQRGKKYSYGFLDISEKINEGRVESLILSCDFLKERNENELNELYSLFEIVEKFKGKVLILTLNEEFTQIINNFSGICGILRY